MLHSHRWLVATILDSTEREHFHVSGTSIGQQCSKEIKTVGKKKRQESREGEGMMDDSNTPFPTCAHNH